MNCPFCNAHLNNSDVLQNLIKDVNGYWMKIKGKCLACNRDISDLKFIAPMFHYNHTLLSNGIEKCKLF